MSDNEEAADPNRKNYISCLTWVKKGVSASVPDKIELTPQELQNIIQSTQSQLQELKDEIDEYDLEETENAAEDSNNKKNEENEEMDEDGSINAADEFNFDKYDEESENIYCHIDGIAEIIDGKDPLITVAESDDEDSEKEDDLIKPNDNLVLVGHIIDEASILEVYVYNEKEGSFYCHHHDYLSYIPLCFEWLSFDPSEEKPGNLCAIGNDTPIIEVWDLDVVGGVGPVFKLGKKPNKKKQIKRVGHKDAVLDIAWNKTYNHILASGSADSTVLLWDLEKGVPSTKYSAFEGIVQSIKWHQTEADMLLTGSMDKKVRLYDCSSGKSKTWRVSGEVEKVTWNYFDPNFCFASTDNGYIECIDVRQDKPIWQKNVQQEEIAGLSMSTSCPGLLISSNKDGSIKVWDVINHLEPKLIYEKQTNLGQIICLEASCDNPYTFAIGGDNKDNNLKVFDVTSIPEVLETFKDRAIGNLPIATKNSEQEAAMDVAKDLNSIAIESKKVKKTKKKRMKKNYSSQYK